MDKTYMQILAENTPQRSGVKSSFLQRCYSFGSVQKELDFEESNLNKTTFQTDDNSLMVKGNDANSIISDAFEGNFSSFSRRDRESIILDAGDGSNYIETLYEEFLEFFLSYSGEQDSLNLLLSYEELCCKGIEELSHVIGKNITMDFKSRNNSTVLQHLQLERNLWRLLRILFKDRLENENNNEEDIFMHNLNNISDRKIVENLYQRSAYVRECQLILDWLEKNADDDSQSTFTNKMDFFADKYMALEHSLNELTTKRHIGSSSIEMDPDAIFREKSCYIHEADRENENRLFKYMFLCIRAGSLKGAQQLAEGFGEVWLAAALEGWRLYHDNNLETEPVEGEELAPVDGNKYRDLWKKACFNASQMPLVPVYEQAIYGSLCGNLKSILPVCETWEDYLWAYVRISVDKLIEQEIRDFTQQERKLEDLPAEYWDKTLDLDEIFQKLEATDDLKLDSKTPLRVLQKYIIINDIPGLIEEMHNWLSNRVLDGPTLRCMTHIILFLRLIGHSTKEELCGPILEAYVKELIKGHKISLIAVYTSTLPREHQVMWYSKFLEGVNDNDERQKCLQYAEDAGLDVSQITKTVVNNIREREPGPLEPSGDLSAITTKDDVLKINAIDWLIFHPTQRAEALRQSNALLRIFIAQRKIDAAKMLFNKIPVDSVDVVLDMAQAKGCKELPAATDNTIREYLCFKAYLEAMEAFNSWFHHSMHAKPKEPQPLPKENVTFKERITYDHEMQQYQINVERWTDVVSTLAMTASDYMLNVLLFTNGGWMIDQRTDDAIEPNRQLQLSCLRKLCIPHIARLLQDVLINEGNYKDAIQLADTICSENYSLYQEFSEEDIEQFLKVTLDSSFALLDKNCDPLGYPSNISEAFDS